MRFQPKSAKELASETLTKPGVYPFEVVEACAATSKKTGREMIKLNVAVYDNGGNPRGRIFDYIMEALPSKLRNFCAATGLDAKYDAGTLSPEDCAGRTGKCKVVIDDKDPAYPPRNAIKDYVPKATGAPAASDPTDDVPF